MLKQRIFPLLVTAGMVLLGLTGCGTENNENISAGMEAIQSQDYDTALTCFEAAKEAGENERLLYRGEGIAYLGKTMYAEAEESFLTALNCSDGLIENMDYDINYYLATAYYKQENYEDAIAVYDAMLAMNSSERDALYFRGAAYTELDQIEEAQKSFDAAIAAAPSDYDRIIDIYSILNEHGYKDIGTAYLQTAMENDTKKMTNYEKGRISYYLEDYENARTYLEKARDEDGYEAVLYLGKTYEILGDNNYAISVYNTYLENHPEAAQVWNQMGLCKLNMEDNEGALQAFQTAMQIEDNGMMQTLKMNEIIAYERLNDFKKASVLIESYLKSYPDDETAQREYLFLKTR